MPRTFKPCDGLPHDFDPQHCESDWMQYLAETAATETTMAERSRARHASHTAAEAVAAAALPPKKDE